MVPDSVTTDRSATYPPALAATVPTALHETGKLVQQRIARDHQHRKGRLRPMRGFKTLDGAKIFCRAHAFMRNLRGYCYDFEWLVDTAPASPVPPVLQAWDTLTSDLLGR